ncbi:hypothetical protein M0D69_04705 [Caballeronia sp. SEWSISQ10-4 2]|uniref:hypothetical protein n=1 Tax=Caballeronia sp. SEWSISQ10-4 2 TaxID=2937438 RepID=UPI00264C917E|nr:hypothetical protein [Caballeronia sp. SEWSISQ10-4 2]MDN7177324.1 hypothetical protein [Caballeronia sp. SEWSISQ10-4 2]
MENIQTLSDHSPELMALENDAERATAAFKAADIAYQESKRVMQKTHWAYDKALMAREDESGRILIELERAARPELEAAIANLESFDLLLRRAIRVGYFGDEDVGKPISNADDIAAARKEVAAAQRAIRELAHDAQMPGDEMVRRCTKLVDGALLAGIEWVPKDKWNHAAAGSRNY